MKIGLINNPLSRNNRERGLGPIAAMADAHGVVRVAESDMTGMADTLERFAADGVELLAVNGGDGTVREVMTRIWRDRPFDIPPALAVLRGGRSNAIAEDCGLKGASDRAFQRLLEANEKGRIASNIVERRLICVEGAVGRQAQYGMLFATAGAVHVIDFTRARIDPLGLPVWASDTLSLAGLAARQIRRPQKRYAFKGYPIDGEADGKPLPFSHSALLFAVTLDTLVLGAKPYWDDSSGPVRLTMISHPPRNLLRFLPRFLFGWPSRDLPQDQFFSSGAREVTLRFDGRYVLDGEFFDAEKDSPIRLTARETARFVRL